MSAANRRTMSTAKRATPAERAEECHNEQIKLKEEAAQRREAAAAKPDGKRKSAA